MRQHDDWETPGLRLSPIAPGVGPFPGARFLQAVAKSDVGRVLLTESEAGLAPLLLDRELRFIGPANLVDYRSPLGAEGSQVVAAAVDSLAPGQRYRFDSLPREAAEAIRRSLGEAGRPSHVRRTGQTNVLSLPGTVEAHVAETADQRRGLGRHRSRLARDLGTPELDSGARFFDVFIDLHRGSVGDKGRFMTTEMTGFFAELIHSPGWQVDVLRVGRAVAAAAFGCRHDDGYFLYNIVFDRRMGQYAPGLLLIESLIEAAINDSMMRFDLLKGTEPFKLGFGARPRPLYTIEGSA